jgi:triosephosphate isomerase
MKKIILANLKMNFTQEELKKYLKQLLKNNFSKECEVVVIPSFTSLAVANQMLFGKDVLLGAQNVSDKDSGAFTGEVSARMLKELDVSFALVGHSERRKYFSEKNNTINQKIKTLLKYGMKSVLCVGETEKERQQEKTSIVLKAQIEQAVSGLYENELKSIIIAYEPVWAIGTGKSASVKDVLSAVKSIRNIIKQNYSKDAAENIIIVYGGSINTSNAKNYLEQSQINGALVGGASLDAEDFFKIISSY